MRQKSGKQALAFFLLGALILIIATLALQNFSPNPDLPTFLIHALANTAFVLLAVAIVNGAWWLLGGEPVTTALEHLSDSVERQVNQLKESIGLVNDSYQTGVVRVLGDSDAVSRELTPRRERFRSAKERIDLMGISLYGWSKDSALDEWILALVRNGVAIKILVMDPDNPYFEALLNKLLPSVSDASIRGEMVSIQEFERIQESVDAVKASERITGDFAFRTVRSGSIIYNVLRVDDEMRVIPYLYSTLTKESPMLVLRGRDSPVFRTYEKEFDRLWAYNAPPPATPSATIG